MESCGENHQSDHDAERQDDGSWAEIVFSAFAHFGALASLACGHRRNRFVVKAQRGNAVHEADDQHAVFDGILA